MPSVADEVRAAAAPSQGRAAGECPPLWTQGWKWSEVATISSPVRSASDREVEQRGGIELLGGGLVADADGHAVGSYG